MRPKKIAVIRYERLFHNLSRLFEDAVIRYWHNKIVVIRYIGLKFIP